MKTFLKITLGFLAAIIIIIGSLVGYKAYQGTKNDKESKAAAAAIISEVGKDWSKDSLIKLSSTEMKVQLNDPKTDAYFAEVKTNFGNLVKLGDPKGDSIENFDPKTGIHNYAHYVSESKFESGDARIELTLILESSGWKAYQFKIDKMATAASN